MLKSKPNRIFENGVSEQLVVLLHGRVLALKKNFFYTISKILYFCTFKLKKNLTQKTKLLIH